MGERQEGDEPMLHCGTIRWNDSIDANDVVVRQHHALGVPVVPLVNTSSNVSSATGRFQAAWACFPVRREERIVVVGSSDNASTVVVGNSRDRPPAVWRLAPGAEDEVPCARRPDDHLDRVGRHPKVERDEDELACIAPK
jgi:hypothetical protein